MSIATYQDTVLIYNPVAGKVRANGGRIVGRAVECLAAVGIRARAVPTTGPNTATAIAHEAAAGDPDLIVALGGDGTINEVANGLVHTQVPLAVLPAGTANVLAHELGFGGSVERAARMIPECAPERIAVGRVHSGLGARYFLMMAGAGLDAFIVQKVDGGLKARVGKLAYWIAGFSLATHKIAQLDARFNGATERCGFIVAARVRNYGGDLTIAENASLLDHDFEVVAFQGRVAPRYLVHLAGVLTRSIDRFPGVRIDRTRNLEFREAGGEPVYVQVDGEYAGRLPARVEIVDAALTLMVPADARQRLGLKIAELPLPAAG
jgi:diacylglycerol kinase (ATP)